MSEIGQLSPDKTPPIPTINDWIVPKNIILITPDSERLLVDPTSYTHIRAVSAIWSQTDNDQTAPGTNSVNSFNLIRLFEHEQTSDLTNLIRPLDHIETQVQHGTVTERGISSKHLSEGAAAQLVSECTLASLKIPRYQYNSYGKTRSVNSLIGGVLVAKVDNHSYVKRAFIARSTAWEVGSAMYRLEEARRNYHWSTNPKNKPISKILESIPSTSIESDNQHFMLSVGLRIMRNAMNDANRTNSFNVLVPSNVSILAKR
jgi:hypothetical protein